MQCCGQNKILGLICIPTQSLQPPVVMVSIGNRWYENYSVFWRFCSDTSNMTYSYIFYVSRNYQRVNPQYSIHIF